MRWWARRLNVNAEDEQDGTASLADESRADPPLTSVNPDNKAKADVLVRADRRITMSWHQSWHQSRAHNIVERLGFLKLCAR